MLQGNSLLLSVYIYLRLDELSPCLSYFAPCWDTHDLKEKRFYFGLRVSQWSVGSKGKTAQQRGMVGESCPRLGTQDTEGGGQASPLATYR